MKRLLTLVVLGLLLFTGCQKEELLPTEIRVKTESVTGSRARFTIAPGNPHAYYTGVLVSRMDANFNEPAADICKEAILEMEEAFLFFEDGNFQEAFFYQGSRQLTLQSLRSDLDFKFIVFQINPRTNEIIGEPVVTTFHTNPVPQRDLHFQVDFEGVVMTVTPSDNDLTYFGQFEESELIYNNYGSASGYLYAMAGMYQEYGFIEYSYFSGPTVVDFSTERNLVDGSEYTAVICGCEDGEFTTPPTIVKFRYHPGNIEMLEISEGDEWGKQS